MRIIFTRADTEYYLKHVPYGCWLLDDSDTLVSAVFGYTAYETLVLDKLFELFSRYECSNCITVYDRREVCTYCDILEIPHIIVTSQYTSESDPHIFI